MDGTFRLPPEQAMALADEDSPAFIPGAFQLAAAVIKDEPHIAERFRSGDGFGRLTEVLNEGGFSRVRRAAETPFNMVLEARA